jgi:hypothetical protein
MRKVPVVDFSYGKAGDQPSSSEALGFPISKMAEKAQRLRPLALNLIDRC